MCTGNSAAHGFIQTRSPLPSQSISEDAGPHGLSIFGTSVGPASHVAPSVLAETSSSSTRLASRTPPCQGEPGLHCSSGPLEEPSVDGTGCAPGHGLQKEGGLDRRLQLRLGGGGGGALCDVKPVFGLWSKKKGYLHILVLLDSMTVVSYLNHQGGLSLRPSF